MDAASWYATLTGAGPDLVAADKNPAGMVRRCPADYAECPISAPINPSQTSTSTWREWIALDLYVGSGSGSGSSMHQPWLRPASEERT